MYCPQCGTKIDDEARFCPECGTGIEVESKFVLSENIKGFFGSREKYAVNCIIFTNISLLSKELKTEPQAVKELLNSFIEIKKKAKILYTLIDVGDYTYHKSGLFSSAKKVSLNQKSTLWEYMEILMDVYKHHETRPEYLFIIGSNNVIPMPSVKHYVANDKNDDSIDTDILYSYPYGSNMLPLLENQEIFKQEQLFNVGRLPFGSDSDINDLYSYLQRDVDYTFGIPFTQAYGQCDPNWKNVSTKVASLILPFMRNFDGRLADQYYYNRIILSPMIDEGNVEQIFDTDSSLYFYNLHGGKAIKVRGYAGAPRGERCTRMVLQPEHMRTAQQPNIVVCEACYGARFIALDKHHSMLLSSIHNNTMTFLGSSRVAWGCTDQENTTPQNARLSNADIMAFTFMWALTEGYSTGQAIFLARENVLKNSKPGNPISALTVVEFNLFGDPLIFIDLNKNKALQHEYKSISKSAFVDECVNTKCSVKYIKEGEEKGSLLELVRSATDANIAHLRNTIEKELYNSFGLTPRPAESTFKISYSDGSEEYNFKYKSSEPESDIATYYLVTIDSDGNIKEINSSK